MNSRLGLSMAAASIVALGSLSFAGLTPANAAPVVSAAATAKPYDFNGDGTPDATLGSPYGKVGSQASAGFVTVIYHRNDLEKQVISQSTSGVPGLSEAGDEFGSSLGSADLDQDGYADLIVGARGEDIPAGSNAGAIWILWGSASGLKEATNVTEPTEPGAGNRFGAAVTAGSFNGGTVAPMAIVAAPGKGKFYGFRFEEGKRTAPKVRKRPLRAAKANADASSVDALYLAAGDVDGDSIDDLALGIRDEDGAVNKYTAGVLLGATVDEFKDDHGSAVLDSIHGVTIGDFDGDKDGDLAVGNSGDGGSKGGQVTVFRGGSDPISEGNVQKINQDTGKIPGAGETGDMFGYSVAAGDENNDGLDDLFIGVPGEDLGSKKDAGMAVHLQGTKDGLGTDTNPSHVHQDTAGVPGAAEAGDKFGWEVGVLKYTDMHARLMVGVPWENGTEGTYAEFIDGRLWQENETYSAKKLGVNGVGARVGVRVGRS